VTKQSQHVRIQAQTLDVGDQMVVVVLMEVERK
jgi:hypothetical protein